MRFIFRVLPWLFSLLLSIFPSLIRYSPPLDWEASALVVLEAIKTRNIDAIEALMCKNIKDNFSNLREDIGKFINAIEGDIVTLTKSGANGSGYASSRGAIEQKKSAWFIETTAGTYSFSIDWEIYNNFAFEERGIRAMGLTVKTDDGWISCGVGILATEGIWSSHK